MFKHFLFVLLIVATGCGTTSACSSAIVKDTTPSWRGSGRYAGELNVDCNTVQANRSNGIIGCAFVDGAIGGNIAIAPLFTGNIVGVSYNCKNFNVQTDAYNINYLQMTSLYSAANSQSCSFTMGRTLIDGKYTADDTMISRLFIKIIPKGNYYAKMDFTVNNVNFSGVGWYQNKSNLQEAGNDPILTINPSGEGGIFKVTCGDEVILTQSYIYRPFKVEFPRTLKTCDYEMAAINATSSKIDLGTFVYNVAYATIDINNPTVAIKKSKITFNFTDKVGGSYAVAGIKADATLCKSTHTCTIPHNKDLYCVRALTMGARLFWGCYRVSSQKWEIY